jgi:hypothetical protein
MMALISEISTDVNLVLCSTVHRCHVSHLAGVLQLDELTLQQDLLFHPALQNREKGGNFS